MTKKSVIVRNKRPVKHSAQACTRYERYGHPHSTYRKFHLCRIYFHELTYKGQVPGVKKAN